MKVYFAPMEGVTGFVCRNAYEAYFKGSVDKYFAPFITARIMKSVTTKDLKDILPENNAGLRLVPQLLANRADAFIQTAEAVASLGYDEINLNLGCPSKTVVTKKKGAGFLAEPEELDDFLEEVCTWCDRKNIRLSVKTRLGMYEEDEFEHLLEIYNKYKLHELIIHARTQSDYYSGRPHYEAFARAFRSSINPVCYNGDLFDRPRIESFCTENPEVDCLMIGRGFLMHPGMQLRGADKSETDTGQTNARKAQPESGTGRVNTCEGPYFMQHSNCADCTDEKYMVNLWQFHDAVYEGYQRNIQGEKNVLFKMKELWAYFGISFPKEEQSVKKALKQLQKSSSFRDYDIAVRILKTV